MNFGRRHRRIFAKAALRVALCVGALGASQATHAGAFDKINLKLGGFYNAAAVSVTQSGGKDLRAHSFVSTGEIYVHGWSNLGDDWSIGFRSEFELEKDNGYSEPFVRNVQYTDDLVDEVWGYVEGPYGRMEFGQQDGVADQMMFYGPTVSQAIRVNNPDIFLLECPDTSSCSGSFSYHPFMPNGLQLRTDMHVSEDYTKLIYYSPRIEGFQVGVSYAPELVRNFTGFATRQSHQLNQQSQIWEIAVNYAQRFGDVDLGLSAAFLTGQNEDKSYSYGSGLESDDVQEVGFGALVGWRNWTLGGSYRRTNVLGGGPILNDASTGFNYNVFKNFETTTWDAGLKYETGPWSFGLNYVKADAELPFDTINQTGEGIEVAAGLIVGPGIQLAAGYQRLSFQGPNGDCASFGTCDTTDANIIYLETSFSF